MHSERTTERQVACYAVATALVAAAGAWSCTGCDGHSKRAGDARPIEQVRVHPQFNYETTKEVLVTVEVTDEAGNPRQGVLVSVFEQDGEKLSSGITDDFGLYQQPLTVPAHHEQLEVIADVIGTVSNKTVDIAPSVKVAFETSGAAS